MRPGSDSSSVNARIPFRNCPIVAAALDPFADDVADRKPEPAIGQRQRVEPVAADVERRHPR